MPITPIVKSWTSERDSAPVALLQSIADFAQIGRCISQFVNRVPCRELASAGVLAAMLSALPAAAQEARPLGPFTLRLGSTIVWDTNIFRLPENAPDPQLSRGISGKSDRFATTSLGLSFDKSYWQQRLSFEFVQTATRYEKFTLLDRNSLDYRGVWQWQFTPRISGAVRASSSQSLVSFEYAQGVERIVRTTTNRGFTVDGWIFGGWHLLAGASEDKTSSSQSFLAVPDSTQTSVEYGLRYLSSSQSSVTVTRRSRRGSFSTQPGDPAGGAFTVRESEAAATWAASGRSTLNGRVTRVERRNDDFPDRDFSGVGGELGYSWTPTGKLSIGFSALRAISPFFAAGSTSRIDNSLAFIPAWRVSERTTLRMRASRQVSDFRGQTGSVGGSARHDVLRSLELSADFAPHPKVLLGASLRREQRTSTDVTAPFEDTLGMATATVRF